MSKVREFIKETIPREATKAIFALGCFWCLEAIFEKTEGVFGAINGYAGGTSKNPTYEEVCSQKTDWREAVLVYYNAEEINYQTLLTIFFENIDPSQTDGQFADKGFAYTTAVFYQNQIEREIAQKFIHKLKSKKIFSKIETKILPYTSFFEAEEYHQSYYLKNPLQYQSYYQASGRLKYKNCQKCDLSDM